MPTNPQNMQSGFSKLNKDNRKYDDFKLNIGDLVIAETDNEYYISQGDKKIEGIVVLRSNGLDTDFIVNNWYTIYNPDKKVSKNVSDVSYRFKLLNANQPTNI